MPAPPPYAIGALASRTGLSVRALRHYEAIGLLVPAARSDAGHRRYSVSDVERLQRIVSLRALGLPLADIGRALDAADPIDVVERHLAAVRTRIDAAQRLADRLAALADHLRYTGACSVDDLLSLIRLTTMFETHYTPEQLQQLRDREASLGPDAIADVQQQWARLFAAFDAQREAGTPPEAPVLEPLVAQARTLVGAFTGGDAGLRASLGEAYVDDKAAMYTAWGVAPELGAYYDAAMSAHGGI